MLIKRPQVWQGECRFLRSGLGGRHLLPCPHTLSDNLGVNTAVLSGTTGLGVKPADRDKNEMNTNTREMVWGGCNVFSTEKIKISSSDPQFVTPPSSNRRTSKSPLASQPRNVSARKKEVRKSNKVMKGCVLIRLTCRNLCWQKNVCLRCFTLTLWSDFLLVLTALCANPPPPLKKKIIRFFFPKHSD